MSVDITSNFLSVDRSKIVWRNTLHRYGPD